MASNFPLDSTTKPLLVGTFTNHREACVDSLKELARLSDTLGLAEGIAMPCPLRQITAATLLGSGKIEELAKLAKEEKCGVVIFDDELSPSQQRNLEKLFAIPVMDRTEVILQVFLHHAKTREAKLQIETAMIRFQMPRLKRLWTHLSRQKGGGAQTKGEGEKQIELDRRMLRDELLQLEKELKVVRATRSTQRKARERQGIPTFAIVGYTNAGKSTLLKALTQADVLVEDKLFATLDTTTRKYRLPDRKEILLIDTVGFIKKLPHTLVAAFRSTLEEATEADVLIHLIDASHPEAQAQAEATLAVLKELKAEKKPIITVLNKIDAVEDQMVVNRLRLRFAPSICISALTHEGFEDLLQALEKAAMQGWQTLSLSIPQSDFALIARIEKQGKVLSKDFEENNVLIKAELPPPLIGPCEKYQVE